MKKLYYLIVLSLILGLVLTGCSLLSNISQVPATGQSGITYLTKGLYTGLVGLWSFDEGIGNKAYDSSGYGNDGTITGATYVGSVNAVFGDALSFDGSYDYVNVLDSSTLEPSKITVEAWVKNSETPGRIKYIISKVYDGKLGNYSSYAFYTGGSGGLRFYVGSTSTWVGSPDAGDSLWDGNWHHIAGTYDGSVVRLFVDGEEVKEGNPATLTIAYDGGDLYIGCYCPYYDYPTCFPGLIDEVRIWNTALSPSTIADHAAGICGFNGLMDPYAPPEQKTFKFGRTIPLKWQYTDFDGNVVDSFDASPVVECQFADGGGGGGDLELTDDPGLSGLRYKSDSKTWQFNWQTKDLEYGAGTYKIWITSIQTGQVNGPFLIELL
jgi:hypothetical protein